MTLKELLNEKDMFAKSSGIQLVEVREGYARAQMTVEKRHLNMGGVCQGGAIFTLADFAFAAVCTCHGKLTVGLENTVSFLHSA
ncbi:MAG: PaaI family thioesterase, partial [Bacteroidales bacterium]|nr:PaaI family thioesterase [Bacteroidales bacterium]